MFIVNLDFIGSILFMGLMGLVIVWVIVWWGGSERVMGSWYRVE